MVSSLRSLSFGTGLRLLTIISLSFLISGAALAQSYWSIHEGQSGGFRENATNVTIFDGATIFTINTGYPDPQHNDFRVYIPPGTVSVSLTFNSASTAWVGTASRAGTEPSGNYEGITTANFLSLNWEGDDGGSLNRLIASDYLARNVGGHGTIMYHRSTSILQNGVWIYNKLIEVDGAIVNVHPTITVHKDTFFAWFNSVKDNNSCWDSMGNPIVCGAGVITDGTAALYGKLYTGVTGQTVGISGASLYLTSQISGTHVQSAVTDTLGNYLFSNLEPLASYYVHIEPNSPTDANNIMPFTTQIDPAGIFVGPLQEGTNTKNIELTVSPGGFDVNCGDTAGLEDVIRILQILTGFR